MKEKIGLFKTLIICLYDWMILFSIWFFLSLPFFITAEERYLGNNIFFQLYLLFIVIFYYSWFWIRHKQTLGMKSWRVYIIDTNTNGYGKISIKQCILRLLFSIGGHVFLIFRDKSLQDLISKTHIVKIDHQRKPDSS
tara:strand:- start:184 stop:597 length:414 start_codon:yes stop_codon:yes gene_type:complete